MGEKTEKGGRAVWGKGCPKILIQINAKVSANLRKEAGCA